MTEVKKQTCPVVQAGDPVYFTMLTASYWSSSQPPHGARPSCRLDGPVALRHFILAPVEYATYGIVASVAKQCQLPDPHKNAGLAPGIFGT
ncbi:MAG: hypothetical protein K2Z80_23320 [Xanthobacteraceae bacterium]|nr:hypothetical protein [Xanthobacteraceae bacterium]